MLMVVRRRADRLAAVLIAALSTIPAIAILELAGMVDYLADCNFWCVLAAFTGWLLLVVALVGYGIAWSIWVGTRLGRIVGFGIAVAAVGLAAQASNAALTLAFGVIAGLLLVSTLDWIAEVRRGDA